jgi:glucose-6-phosphate isomerase
LKSFAEEIRQAGFTQVALLGMGGSSLCPEVLKETFGRRGGYPELFVLDSTDPAQIRSLERRLDLSHSLFIVSSKSGSTLEPNIFKDYFLSRMRETVGESLAGSHFVAITDPGSQMQKTAEADGFRKIFFGVAGIGGRYSALSHFGTVPAAVMGLDLDRFLGSAAEMVEACASAPVEENPGVTLGCVLGALASAGRDKVTFIASPGIHDVGAWLEQLLAESTGKQGKGLIPVDREPLGGPQVYGQDRVFAYLRLSAEADAGQDSAVASLESAGQPVIRVELADRYDLGQELFRWEIATAVAGSILRVNPFDQPDVEASKVATRELTAAYEKSGSLPKEEPLLEGSGLSLFTDPENADFLRRGAGAGAGLEAILRTHLGRLKPGDYFALLAYVEMSAEHEELLSAMRLAVRERKQVATCVGFGPRFLHSTGQAYKGGPDTGVFLQITCDDADDLTVPGRKLSFGVVKAAQAQGDFQVLAERRRRALRVHLQGEPLAGLRRLRAALDRSLV